MHVDTQNAIEEVARILEEMYTNIEVNCVDEEETVEMPVFLFEQFYKCYFVLYHNNISKSRLQ